MELKNLLENHRKLGKTIYLVFLLIALYFHDAALKVLVLKLKEKTLGTPEALLTSEKI
jgi:hypothetical protein